VGGDKILDVSPSDSLHLPGSNLRTGELQESLSAADGTRRLFLSFLDCIEIVFCEVGKWAKSLKPRGVVSLEAEVEDACAFECNLLARRFEGLSIFKAIEVNSDVPDMASTVEIQAHDGTISAQNDQVKFLSQAKSSTPERIRTSDTRIRKSFIALIPNISPVIPFSESKIKQGKYTVNKGCVWLVLFGLLWESIAGYGVVRNQNRAKYRAESTTGFRLLGIGSGPLVDPVAFAVASLLLWERGRGGAESSGQGWQEWYADKAT